VQKTKLALPFSCVHCFSSLLVVSEGRYFSPLQSFKKPPPLASPNALLTQIHQMNRIKEIGIDKLDFSRLSENKLKYLAGLGKGYSTSPMQRFSEEKRYSLIACFLKETLTSTIDTAVDMFLALVTAVLRRSIDTFTSCACLSSFAMHYALETSGSKGVAVTCHS
jgi:hypothetical protein